METGLILWSQLSASSSSEGHNASAARLNGTGYWLPADDDNDPWFQVDFAITLWLGRMKMQGAPSADQWVTTFTISYADLSEVFTNFTNNGAIEVKMGTNYIHCNLRLCGKTKDSLSPNMAILHCEPR